MKSTSKQSRRDFIKSTSLAGTAIAGVTLSACTSGSKNETCKNLDFPVFQSQAVNPADGVSGLLFSQVGYEKGLPVKIILRFPKKEILPDGANCLLIPTKNEKKYQTKLKYWGERWKSHWWIAEFKDVVEEGEWNIEIDNSGDVIFKDRGLKVGENILWDSTVPFSSVDMLERRKHFTKVGAGWQDAGTLWVESPAQSAMIISLTELLEKVPNRFNDEFKKRIYTQLTVGCDYLVMTQEKASELGYDKGAMSHDLLGHEHAILPQDASKAVVALYRTARLLPADFVEKKKKYTEVADLTYEWLIEKAKPLGDMGMARRQRGLSEDAFIPEDEWMTRDLITMCWASLEKWKTHTDDTKEKCIDYARQVMNRQIPQNKAESGYYGHFYEYTSTDHSEKSWSHGIVNNTFGADIGELYPNYLMPVIQMLQIWPNHADAGRWKDMLHSFTYGYLIPACRQSPFQIVPLGIYGNEGPIWFASPFHGTNTIYGYTAALALELSKLFDEPELQEIAYDNLQWLAGLNAGITADNLKEAVVFSTNVPKGLALPASMICNVGDRWAGTWFNTRGVICNGFSAGTQFKFDIDPTEENDGPFSFTDEDWIPHSAAWLTGLLRL